MSQISNTALINCLKGVHDSKWSQKLIKISPVEIFGSGNEVHRNSRRTEKLKMNSERFKGILKRNWKGSQKQLQMSSERVDVFNFLDKYFSLKLIMLSVSQLGFLKCIRS